MADVGLLLVGEEAGRLAVEVGAEVPVLRVQGDVQDVLPHAVSGWGRVLVVGWCDAPELVDAARAITAGTERSVTVLLGGNPERADPARRQAVRVVLAALVRKGRIESVLCNNAPVDVIDVALDAARRPEPVRVPLAQPVDLGPVLDLPATWCLPAAPVHFFGLVHVPMGHARRLPELAVLVAAHSALRSLVEGPVVPVKPPPAAVRRSPAPTLESGALRDLGAQVKRALDEIEFSGSEPLVERVDAALSPLALEADRLCERVSEVRAHLVRPMRNFGVGGIVTTQRHLEALLARLPAADEVTHRSALQELLSGGGTGSSIDEAVPITAWRSAFAALPSELVPAQTPGWRLARQLVRERFALFRSELSAQVSHHAEALVRLGLAPDPPTRHVQSLVRRAARVTAALREVLDFLAQRIDVQACEALANDRIVRWCASSPEALVEQLSARIEALPVGLELVRRAQGAIGPHALGRVDDSGFELLLAGLTREAHALPATGTLPSYEDVMLLLLQGRDPPVLRKALAQVDGARADLRLERVLDPALMSWLTATGMRVVVAPRLRTCAVFWQRLDHLDDPAGERLRRADTEQRLSDLALPAVRGDGVLSLARLIEAVAILTVALVLGVVTLGRQEEEGVRALLGGDVPVPPNVVVPYGGLHWLANDPVALARMQGAVRDRLVALSLDPNAPRVVRTLVELAAVGPGPEVVSQLGLRVERLRHLEHPIRSLVQRISETAMTAMVDCLHSSRLDHLARPPRRHTVTDLGRSGPGAH